MISCNRLLTKKDISNTDRRDVYRHCGQKETVIFCDQDHGDSGFGLCLHCRNFFRQGRHGDSRDAKEKPSSHKTRLISCKRIRAAV